MPAHNRPATPTPLDPVFRLGAVQGGGNLTLSYTQLAASTAIFGLPGSGKSVLLELLMRHLIQYEIGFFFLDPHGDTARKVAGYVAALKAHPTLRDDATWRRTHYLRIDPDCLFANDPFAHAPLRSQVSSIRYQSWLDTQIGFLVRAILRRFTSSDTDAMNRLARWLENVLYFCGTSFDDRNSHHGLDKMLLAVTPQHPEFASLLARVEPYLKDYVLADFRALAGTRRVIDQERWVESTINNLRRILTVLVQEVFAQRAPSINFPQIIRQGGQHVLVDMSQTTYWGRFQGFMLGGILLQQVIHAKFQEAELPESQRQRFVLIIDEAGLYLAEDLKEVIKECRKYKMPVVLAAQNLSSFAKGDLDIAGDVLGLCGTVFSFQQTYREDKQALADRLCGGDLSFRQQLTEVQRQRGHLERNMIEVGHSIAEGANWSQTNQRSESQGVNEVVGEALSVMRGYADAVAHSSGTSHGQSSGFSRAINSSAAFNKHPIITNRQLFGTVAIQNSSDGKSEGSQFGQQQGFNEQHSTSHSQSGAVTIGSNRQQGQNRQTGTSIANMRGGARTHGTHWTEKCQLLPNLLSEWEWHGLYEKGSPADQWEQLMQRFHNLSTAEAIVSPRGVKGSLQVKILELKSWWTSEEEAVRAVHNLEKRLRELHPYYFVPGATEADTGSSQTGDHADSNLAGSAPQGAATEEGNPPDQEENPYGH